MAGEDEEGTRAGVLGGMHAAGDEKLRMAAAEGMDVVERGRMPERGSSRFRWLVGRATAGCLAVA